jgi:ketosteroid isomerase-like protein
MSNSRRPAAILTIALLMCLAATACAASAALDSLVASERAFAALSLEKGARDAFLVWLAPDGVIFRPRAVSGREAWASRGPLAATLRWEPSCAEVSAAGDLGWTTGPWELRPNDPQRPVGYGHFVSIWQKQADGTWRVAVDIGISHAKPDRGVGSGDFTPGPTHPDAQRAAVAPDLVRLDLSWADDARARGSAAAFARRAAPDVRFYREGEPPVAGLRAARAKLLAVPGATLWDPDAQKVARSGDLGCTYGVLERRAARDATPDSSVYLHVWRRGADGRWQVALALEDPLPRTGRK